MKVFKFGGASVNSVERIKNLSDILKNFPGEKLLVIISAMGKNTNALEKVTDAFYGGNKDQALQLFEKIKLEHLKVQDELMQAVSHSPLTIRYSLTDFFTEVEWLLHDKPQRGYD